MSEANLFVALCFAAFVIIVLAVYSYFYLEAKKNKKSQNQEENVKKMEICKYSSLFNTGKVICQRRKFSTSICTVFKDDPKAPRCQLFEPKKSGEDETNMNEWTVDNALLEPEIQHHLKELEIAKEQGLENQIKAHIDEIKVICLKKWFGLAGNELRQRPHKGYQFLFEREVFLENAIDIDEYNDSMPLSQLKPILELKKTNIFDEITVREIRNQADSVIIGQIGKHYLLLQKG